MAAQSWYISVHDGMHNVLGMYTDCPSNGLHLQHEGLAAGIVTPGISLYLLQLLPFLCSFGEEDFQIFALNLLGSNCLWLLFCR